MTMRNTLSVPTVQRVALTLLAASALLSHGNLVHAAAASDAKKVHPQTPEVKLVDDYTTWFAGGAARCLLARNVRATVA
jgi:hypothetical protein